MPPPTRRKSRSPCCRAACSSVSSKFRRRRSAAQLEHVLAAEGVAFEPPALNLIARAARAACATRLSLLDQAIAHGAGRSRRIGARHAGLGGPRLPVRTARSARRRADGPAALASGRGWQARSLRFDSALAGSGDAAAPAGAWRRRCPRRWPEDEPDRMPCSSLPQRCSAGRRATALPDRGARPRATLGLAPDEYAGFTMTLMRMLAFAAESGSGCAGSREGRAAGCGAARAGRARIQRVGRSRRSPAAERLPVPRAESSASTGDWPSLVASAQDRRHGAHAGATIASSCSSEGERAELRCRKRTDICWRKPTGTSCRPRWRSISAASCGWRSPRDRPAARRRPRLKTRSARRDSAGDRSHRSRSLRARAGGEFRCASGRRVDPPIEPAQGQTEIHS